MSSFKLVYPFPTNHSSSKAGVPSKLTFDYSRKRDNPYSNLRVSVGRLRFSASGKRIAAKRNISAKTNDQEADSERLGGADKPSGSPSRSFLAVLCPLLNLLGGGDPTKPRNEFLEVTSSSLASLARLPWGSKLSLPNMNQQYSGIFEEKPVKNLQLFEFEACPFCRRVREAAAELDLSLEVYPCPKGSIRHREMVKKLGGKEQFPFLLDPNTGISMYESGQIVKYLYQQYGQGGSPSVGLLESTLFTGWMPTILRAGRGLKLWSESKEVSPPQKLELFSYENNPYARIVREALCELELPYILKNVGEGSSRLPLLYQISGSKEVPYLVDPNNGVQMGNYLEILSYLFRTYAG